MKFHCGHYNLRTLPPKKKKYFECVSWHMGEVEVHGGDHISKVQATKIKGQRFHWDDSMLVPHLRSII